MAVGQVQGRDMLDRVIEYLEAREMLLILDNSEHLVEACAELANAVLRSSPAVKILATSRERLGVPGESGLLGLAVIIALIGVTNTITSPCSRGRVRSDC